MKEDISNSLKILLEGGVILYPTDTVWGIGCDATNENAVQRIYRIKKRKDSKSMLILIDYPDRLNQYVSNIPDIAWKMMNESKNPLTIIYPDVLNLAPGLLAADNSAGIRVAGDDFCQQLIGQFGKPVVSTSANISGNPTPKNFSEIDSLIQKSVDYIVRYRQDDQIPHKPSAVIKLGVNGEVTTIRG